MAFKVKQDHPLNWGDKELKFMLDVAKHHKSINNTVLYHLMGYEGQRPNSSFIERVKRLKLDK